MMSSLASMELVSCLINAQPLPATQPCRRRQMTTPWLAAQATSWQMIGR